MSTDVNADYADHKKTQIIAAKRGRLPQMTTDAEKNGGYLYQDLTYRVRGACYEVYNTLGSGFKEEVYHRALAEEFKLRRIPVSEKPRLVLTYKGKTVGVYEPDFLVDNKVILEIKAVPQMPTAFEAQLYYYLKGTEYRLGLLVNFGAAKLDIRRRIFDTVRISGNQRSSYQRASASRGQALLELAVFGSLMILALGALVNFGLNADSTQQATMGSFRQALGSAAEAPLDGKPSGVSYLRIDDRHVPNPSNPFAIGSVSPVGGEAGSVTRNYQSQLVGTTVPELPRIAVEIKGSKCPGSELSPAGSDPPCFYTTAGFRTEFVQDPGVSDDDQERATLVDRYGEVYGQTNVCAKPECGGACLKTAKKNKSRCLKASKLRIIDQCEGEIIGYNQCIQQARHIVDTQVCTTLCEKGKLPGSRVDCPDLCSKPMNAPWYAQFDPVKSDPPNHQYVFPSLESLFAGIRALGLQPGAVKVTNMDTTLGKEDKRDKKPDGKDEDRKGKTQTASHVKWRDDTTRRLIRTVKPLDYTYDQNNPLAVTRTETPKDTDVTATPKDEDSTVTWTTPW